MKRGIGFAAIIEPLERSVRVDSETVIEGISVVFEKNGSEDA
jgi:hypothetical protein